jgi:osmoprotectant transport system ATP-binding protein
MRKPGFSEPRGSQVLLKKGVLAAMTTAAIVFDRVSKTFPHAARPSVEETSLQIEQGSFVAIVGASGSGKTTLLKMVNRLYEPSSGRVLVQGEDVKGVPATRLRRQIGYVIQQVGLFPHQTVEANIATVPGILGWDSHTIDQRIDFLLDLVHLPPQEYRKRYPRQLSGGQQQRVGLARAMAGDPDILLMDEPFGAIDAITRTSLQDELLQIQQKLNKTILFVTHDIQEALKLADKIIIMNDGQVQQYDTPLQILLHPANEFVRRLVNADDVLQRLSLIQAQSIMTPLDGPPHNAEARVSPQTHLQDVLQVILKSELDSVIVEDAQGTPLGRVSLHQLKIREEAVR